MIWFGLAHLKGYFPATEESGKKEGRRAGGREGRKEGNDKGDVGFNLSMAHTMVDHRHATVPTYRKP